MLEDEHDLILRAKGGEAEAFGRLYDHYLPAIYRFILLKVGQREEAEDLTHHVFLKAWTSMGKSYSEQGFPFSSWLYRIARNSVIDHYRRLRPMSSIEEEENREELINRPSMESLIDKKEASAKIMSALKKLKDTEQDVVIMRFIEDLSVKETAEAVKKSEGAVKVIQHRALEKIKKILSVEEQNG